MATSSPMIVITTSNSTKVKPLRFWNAEERINESLWLVFETGDSTAPETASESAPARYGQRMSRLCMCCENYVSKLDSRRHRGGRTAAPRSLIPLDPPGSLASPLDVAAGFRSRTNMPPDERQTVGPRDRRAGKKFARGFPVLLLRRLLGTSRLGCGKIPTHLWGVEPQPAGLAKILSGLTKPHTLREQHTVIVSKVCPLGRE